MGLQPGMSVEELQNVAPFLLGDDEGARVLQSILTHGNRLRIELGHQFRKHGIRHPQQLIARAGIRRLGVRSYSSGHTEIAVFGKDSMQKVEISGVLYFNDADESEKITYNEFSKKFGIPCIVLDKLRMNPSIETMPFVPAGASGVMVQDLPIDWD